MSRHHDQKDCIGIIRYCNKANILFIFRCQNISPGDAEEALAVQVAYIRVVQF